MEVPAGNGSTGVSLPIVDDEIKENLEQYFVGFLGFSRDLTGAQIGERNTTLLIITDDERKCVLIIYKLDCLRKLLIYRGSFIYF